MYSMLCCQKIKQTPGHVTEVSPFQEWYTENKKIYIVQLNKLSAVFHQV